MISATKPVQQPSTTLAGRREWASLAVLILAVVLLSVDATVLGLAVPALTSALQPTAGELLWIADVYSFALAGLLVLMGGLADRFGRTRVLLIGAAGFGAASALAAFATDPMTLVVARAAQGVAAATLMPSTLSLIRNLFPDARQRTRAIALWSAGASGGAVLGPLVGGVLLEHFWWGSVFLINVPIMVVLLVAGWFLLPESRDPRPGRLDMIGALLSIVAVLAVVFAVKELVGHGATATAAGAALAGVAAAVLFVRRQRRIPNPLVDVRLFANRAFSGALASQLIALIALTGLLFFFSQYLQLVRGHTALEAGLRELPRCWPRWRSCSRWARWSPGWAWGVPSASASRWPAPACWRWPALSRSPGTPGWPLRWWSSAVGSAGLHAEHRCRGQRGRAAPRGHGVRPVRDVVRAGGGPRRRAARQPAGGAHRARSPGGRGRPRRGAARESLARAVEVVGPGRPLDLARESFTWAMQVTAVAAAVLLAVAAATAWRVIPSTRERPGHHG